jgi:hypothetical protein
MSVTRTLWAGTIIVALGILAIFGSPAEAKDHPTRARPANAHGKLVDFVLSGGCRIKLSRNSVARMREIAANGSVTWDGKCARGLISGAGVLREEGIVASGGKTKQVVHHWTGVAIKGIRSGKWKRESFARFVDSKRYWTNVAMVLFVGGIASGRAERVPIRQLGDYSANFRRVVVDARGTPEEGAMSSGEPGQAAVPEPRAVVATAQPGLESKEGSREFVVAGITASSQYQNFGAGGLFRAEGPGWHAATPVRFPQELVVEFRSPVVIRRLGLLRQQGHPERAPRSYKVAVSMDGSAWVLAGATIDACTSNTPDGWNEMNFPNAAVGRFMKLVILSNCGDPSLLTLRGLRLN